MPKYQVKISRKVTILSEALVEVEADDEDGALDVAGDMDELDLTWEETGRRTVSTDLDIEDVLDGD